MFVVCLDQATPNFLNHVTGMTSDGCNRCVTSDVQKCNHVTSKGRDDVSLALQTIHGHGSDVNTGNRWFDKTMQVCYSNYWILTTKT